MISDSLNPRFYLCERAVFKTYIEKKNEIIMLNKDIFNTDQEIGDYQSSFHEFLELNRLLPD